MNTPNPAVARKVFLEVRGLTKHYGPTRALNDLTLEFREGEIHALCGHNGAGKSTLVKLISGIEQPDAGDILIDGEPVVLRSARTAEQYGIAYVQQELSVLPTLTIEENVLIGSRLDGFFSRASRHRRDVRALLDRVGLQDLDPAASASGLTAGEQQLVEIARGIGRDAKLLILDEPTATLSDVEIERVFRVVRQLSAAGTTIVFVSHRLGEVMSLCDRATVMRDGTLEATRDVADLTRGELVEMMVGNVVTRSSIDLLDDDHLDDAEVVVRISALEVPGKVERMSLDIRSGEIVALAGQLGAGASEVLRAIAGLRPDAVGSIRVRDRDLKLSRPRRALLDGVHFISNDRKAEGLFLDHSAGLNLIATRLGRLARFGVVSRQATRRRTRELADDVVFDPKRLGDKASVFSGGNQQKLFVGRTLEHAVSGLILLDEPTRGVDVKGRAEIHQLVRRAAQEGNAVIFASTELDEILDLATTVVTMRAGRMVAHRARRDVDAGSVLRAMTHSDQEAEEPVRG